MAELVKFDHPTAVEQLEQGQLADGERLVAGSFLLRAPEQRLHLAVVENPGQRAARRRARQRGRGIVFAQALVHQKAVELAQGRYLARDRGRREVRPGPAQAGEIVALPVAKVTPSGRLTRMASPPSIEVTSTPVPAVPSRSSLICSSMR